MPLHYNIATEGIRAGHKILAKLGFGFTVQVIITPELDSGGGWGGLIPDQNEYKVTIVITKNGKKWSKSMDASWFGAKSLERVMVSLKAINTVVENVMFHISKPLINIKQIFVKARKK